jgi:hypothetical protein
MKNILLTLAAFLTISLLASAQSFKLTTHDGELTHDTTLRVFSTPDVSVVEKHVYITNITASTIKMLVKKEELEILDGTMNTFCFNQLCFPPTIFTAPFPLTIEAGATTDDLGFYGDYYPNGNSGNTLIRYTFFVEENPNDSLSVIINYGTRNFSFAVADANGPLTHDTTIQIIDSPDAAEIKAYLFVTNLADEARHLLVRKEEIEIVEGTQNAFCFVDRCFPPSTFLSPFYMVLEPGQTTTAEEFYGDYYPDGLEGDSYIRYVFFAEDEPGDEFSVTIKYSVTGVGIHEKLAASSSVSPAFPNPANEVFRLSLDLDHRVEQPLLVVRNLLGQIILTQAINTLNGTVSVPVDGLKEGFYLYTITIQNNYPLHTGRLIISR